MPGWLSGKKGQKSKLGLKIKNSSLLKSLDFNLIATEYLLVHIQLEIIYDVLSSYR